MFARLKVSALPFSVLFLVCATYAWTISQSRAQAPSDDRASDAPVSSVWRTGGSDIIPIPTARPEGGAAGFLPFTSVQTQAAAFPKQNAQLHVSATLAGTGLPIESGMIWRIYGDTENPEGKLPLIATYSGGRAAFDLPSGYYYVHGSFGYAEQTKRIKLLPPFAETAFRLEAGGLRLNAAFREGDFIPSKYLKFEIAHQQGNSLKTLVSDVEADELIRLPAGQYHVTSRYGSINSEVSADVRIDPGELTDLTLYQRGAEITLKLVSERGGEALANTSWTVLTPGGDPVVNTVASAFPSFVLAAGDYVAFARHEDRNYTASFTIESGVHRDVEVLLEQQN